MSDWKTLGHQWVNPILSLSSLPEVEDLSIPSKIIYGSSSQSNELQNLKCCWKEHATYVTNTPDITQGILCVLEAPWKGLETKTKYIFVIAERRGCQAGMETSALRHSWNLKDLKATDMCVTQCGSREELPAIQRVPMYSSEHCSVTKRKRVCIRNPGMICGRCCKSSWTAISGVVSISHHGKLHNAPRGFLCTEQLALK